MNLVRALASAWLIAAVAAFALVACDKADNRVKAADTQRSPPQSASSTPSPAPPPSQTTQADTRTDVNASETAKGSDAPMKSMDKNEEQKAMPQPGQANDHSTLAQDPKQSSESK